MSLEKILVPLDGSELAERIVAQVRRILIRKDARVLLARVVPREALEASPRGEAIDVARAYLDGIRERLRADGATVESEVLVGPPAERILAFAETWRPSLVAMATHGRTGLARWIRGSVAERVLRASRFPLLLANPFGPEKGERRFRRILVPLDGSKESATILPLVREVANLYESEVILQFVIQIPIVEYPAAVTVTREEGDAILREHLKELPGVRTRIHSSLGMPASSILDLAREEHADLIAMTTHGRSGASRWAFGSVAEQVVRHAPCPVLVKRTTAVEGVIQ